MNELGIIMTNRLKQLKRHEGDKLRAYKCTANHWTIGVGYNLDANPLRLSAFEIADFKKNGITQLISDHLTNLMVDAVEDSLVKKLGFYSALSEPRQTVLLNMAYNMGLMGLLKFEHTLKLIKSGDYEMAAIEMLNSTWAKQVKGRAKELSEQMRAGDYA
jgi:lysozyme